MPQSFTDQLRSIPISPNLGQSLERAHRSARDQSHRLVTLEHLLLALTEDAEAALILRSAHVDLDRLSTDVSGYLGRLLDDMRAEPGAEPRPDAELLRVLQGAASAAQQSRRKQIDGAVVLAAIVGDGTSPAAGLLNALGMTYEEAIRALQRANTQARLKPLAKAATAVPAGDVQSSKQCRAPDGGDTASPGFRHAGGRGVIIRRPAFGAPIGGRAPGCRARPHSAAHCSKGGPARALGCPRGAADATTGPKPPARRNEHRAGGRAFRPDADQVRNLGDRGGDGVAGLARVGAGLAADDAVAGGALASYRRTARECSARLRRLSTNNSCSGPPDAIGTTIGATPPACSACATASAHPCIAATFSRKAGAGQHDREAVTAAASAWPGTARPAERACAADGEHPAAHACRCASHGRSASCQGQG